MTTRAGIRSVRIGSRPWTDTDTEVDRSFKAVRTDVIGTEEQSEPTDVESEFLHVRTEPIGKIVAFTEPNRYYVIAAGSPIARSSNAAARRTTRKYVPRARMRTMGENTHHAPMRTTRENAHHARECAPRARMRTTRENAYHA